MNPYRRNQLMLTSGLGIALAAYLLLYWLPHCKEMARLRASIRQTEATIQSQAEHTRRLALVRNELAQLQGYLNSVRARLPAELQIGKFLSELYTLGQQTGVDTPQTQPQLPGKLLELDQQSIHLTLAGSCPAIARLLHRLETGPRLVELTAVCLTVARDRKPAGQVEADVEVKLFALPQPPPPADRS